MIQRFSQQLTRDNPDDSQTEAALDLVTNWLGKLGIAHPLKNKAHANGYVSSFAPTPELPSAPRRSCVNLRGLGVQ